MQIPHVRTFLAIVVGGSFSEAAEVLYTTQPTVSKQVMTLEKELGVTLFDRGKRAVALTPAGEMFLVYADRFWATY